MIWQAIYSSSKLTLFSKEMTRFLIDAEEALDLIFKGLALDGASIIPKSKSAKILDLFEIYKEKFNLKYIIGNPRVGEKIHEILASKEEMQRMSNSECGTFFILRPIISNDIPVFDGLTIGEDYSSKDSLILKSELNKLLDKYNYFEP